MKPAISKKLAIALALVSLVGTSASGQGAPPPTRIPSLAPLVNSVKSAVVNVDTRTTVEPPDEELLQRFFGQRGLLMDRSPRYVMGTGSGFIIGAEGKVLTNAHLVAKVADIRVRLDDGREFAARVLGADPLSDVALLQLQGDVKGLPVVTLGDSDAMKVGDWVLAIGNPFGLASSVSTGIISAKERDIHAGPYDDFIQTDAAINPGNSGGPLFNLEGQVVGISTAIVGGSSGIGFAVPSNMATALLPQLEKGAVKRGYLGVAIQDLTPALARGLGIETQKGAIVSDVDAKTPAGQAGLHQDDVIVAIDGQALESARVLSRIVAAKEPGSKVTLGVLRDGKPKQLTVKLGTRPDLESEEGRPAVGQNDQPKRDGAVPLGLAFQTAPDGAGALLTQVEPGSAADRAGLLAGMVVTELGGKPVKTAKDLARMLTAAKPGATLIVRVEVEGFGRALRALEIPRPSATG